MTSVDERSRSAPSSRQSRCDRHGGHDDYDPVRATQLKRKMILSALESNRGSVKGSLVQRKEHKCSKKKSGNGSLTSSAQSRGTVVTDLSRRLSVTEVDVDNDSGSGWSSDDDSELIFGTPIPRQAQSEKATENLNDDELFVQRNYRGQTKVVEEEPTLGVYKRACKLLGLISSTRVSRALPTSEMSLRYQGFGPIGIKACAIALVNNTKVSKLDLTGNNMQDLGAEYIAETMSANLYITHLALAENKISSVGLESLTEVLKNSQYIRHLNLAGNNFLESDAKHVADILENNVSLKFLDVSGNCFSDSGGQLIGPALGENNTLQMIDLGWNHIRRKGAIAILEGIRHNVSLKVAALGWNGFGLEGAVALGNCLEHNEDLVYLDITNNRINHENLMFILRGLKKNSTLKYLKMGRNPLTTAGAMLTLQTIKQNESIAICELDLSGQSVDEEFVDDLAELSEARPSLRVAHGVVLRRKDVSMDADGEFLSEDPMMVLMEFMRQKNMRLVDLFTKLDTDGSKSLTRDEFRDGLLLVNIPMSGASVDKLLDVLDSDGDGEVDFAELMDGQKEYRRKLTIIQQKIRKMGDMDPNENEMSRITRKVAQLLKVKDAMVTANDNDLPDTAEEQSLRRLGKKVMNMNVMKAKEAGKLDVVADALQGLKEGGEKKKILLNTATTHSFTAIASILAASATPLP